MSGASYRVLDPTQPDKAADPLITPIAEQIRTAAATNSPRRTGQYAAGWQVEHTKTGTYRVYNSTPYGHFVEYGTRYMAAHPAFGQAIALAKARYAR